MRDGRLGPQRWFWHSWGKSSFGVVNFYVLFFGIDVIVYCDSVLAQTSDGDRNFVVIVDDNLMLDDDVFSLADFRYYESVKRHFSLVTH